MAIRLAGVVLVAGLAASCGRSDCRECQREKCSDLVVELEVVSAAPGVGPEKDLLTAIERERGSTLLPQGQWVLDEARLRELGDELTTIAPLFPVDEEVLASARVLLDTEWKLRADGQLVVKQVRPFLALLLPPAMPF